jgi:catechol 2,3-dioxygenase-like lactoylglutathione lyase family enzyme
MIRTIRISHPARTGARSAATLRFSTEVLGMERVLRQPTLDYPSEERLFFHVGNDNFIAYFVPKDEVAARYEAARPGSGGMDHLALDVDPETLAEALARLKAEGIAVEGPTGPGLRALDLLQRPQRRDDRAARLDHAAPARPAVGRRDQARAGHPRGARRHLHRGPGRTAGDRRA